MNELPAAVLWDFDGTLVDSETMWDIVERNLAKELGGELPADYHEITIGGTIENTAKYIRSQTGTDRPADEIAAELWARAIAELSVGPIRWLPGVLDLVTALTGAGVPQAVVSSGHRAYLDVTLRRLDPSPFAVEVAGDEVTANKPEPEPYLRGAALLGVDPAACLAVEDSRSGADSGRAAGCAVLAVPSFGVRLDRTDLVVASSLADVDLDGFMELAARAFEASAVAGRDYASRP